MERYRDVDADSGAVAYEIGPDFIRVQFADGSIYLYTNASASPKNIDRMKQLARAGEGLNNFININVRKGYARKER